MSSDTDIDGYSNFHLHCKMCGIPSKIICKLVFEDYMDERKYLNDVECSFNLCEKCKCLIKNYILQNMIMDEQSFDDLIDKCDEIDDCGNK